MGGTSGAVYSLMFVGASLNAPNWTMAWESGLDMVMKYSSARLGHRTMVRCMILNISLKYLMKNWTVNKCFLFCFEE